MPPERNHARHASRRALALTSFAALVYYVFMRSRKVKAAPHISKYVWSSPDSWKTYVSDEFYSLLTNLVTEQRWEIYRDGADAEVLLFVEEYEPLLKNVDMLRRKVDVLVIFVDDLHWHNAETWRMKLEVFKLESVYVLSTYAYMAQKLYPQLASFDRWFWLPHSASERFQVTLNDSAVHSHVLLTGALTPTWYPYRALVQELGHDGELNVFNIAHQGYDARVIEADSANFIQASHACALAITCGSRLHYALAKFFEIPALGQLLFANSEMVPILRQLKLEKGVHYISYNAHNLVQTMRSVTDVSGPAFLRMRQKAQAIVLQFHSTAKRAAQLNDIVSCIRRNKSYKRMLKRQCHRWQFEGEHVDNLVLDPDMHLLLRHKRKIEQ